MNRIAMVVWCCCFAVVSACAQAQPPNVVVLLADDMGWRDPGFMGSDYHQTPHLDALAAESRVFMQAYANAPNCAPSRAALMSGMYAPRTGVYTVHPPDRGRAENRRWVPAGNTTDLAPGVRTLAEALRSAGYRTIHIGKWHLGRHDNASRPEAQGFDRNIAGHHIGHPKSYFSPYRNPALTDGPKGEYLTDRLTDEAISFLKDQDGSAPFFLYLPYYTVHTPMQPRRDLLAEAESRPAGERHTRADFAAMMAAFDESVGRILETLEATGHAENTIVVFSSDNGGHGRMTNMAPLRGSKGMLYEGGIRVPLTLRWPGVVAPGVDETTPVMLFDLYPTLCEAAGVDLGQEQPVDGVSWGPRLRDASAELPERALFWHFPAYLQGYGGGQGRWRATPASVIRYGDWKLIEQYETDTVELYHLAEDVGERRNVADAQPEVRARLLAELRRWQERVDAPTSFEPNPRYRAE